MNFTERVAPHFQHDVIHILCHKLDHDMDQEDLESLIHFMSVAIDRYSPLNRAINTIIENVEGLQYQTR